MSEITKQYNKLPARYNINIVQSKKCSLDVVKETCNNKGLDTLDFILWYDEKLLHSSVSVHLAPFDYILQSISAGIITYKAPIKHFRMACLILQEFSKCNKSQVAAMRTAFLKDHPHFLDAVCTDVDFDSLYNYNHYTANKIMFPYFARQHIDKDLIAELISRKMLAFDDTYKIKNIIYVCQDLYDNHGIEILGMTEKHYQRLKGQPFPFVYLAEEFDAFSMEDVTKVEFFGSTIKMLQHLSELRASEDGIPARTAFASLHTDNYNMEAYLAFKKSFPNAKETWHCTKKELPAEVVKQTAPAVSVNQILPTLDNESVMYVCAPTPEPAPELYYTKAQLIQMKEADTLTYDIFEPGYYDILATFEEVISLPQVKSEDGKISFIHPEHGELSINGCSTNELPF